MATTKQILGKVVITNKGEYIPSTIYEILDVVSYQGSSYLSKVYDNNSLPTDGTKWQLLAKKGDTYEVSETDIENIANQITENANSNFNRNVSEKTETFNSNAKTKTDEFNSNANNTVSAYNVNAENKLKEYNENDTVKLKKYNDNATSSVDNYNSNAGTKLNEYNTNSVNKLKEYNNNATKAFNNYNSNATTKLDEYNTNSSDKLKEYNDNATKVFNNYNSNATTKLDEYNTNSDTKLKEYDEHSEELNTKINSTKNELERVKNNVLETGMGTGNFIHLEDSAMAELQELEVEGICEQKTTVGKNSLNVSKTIENSNGIKTTYNEDGSITITGIPTVSWTDLTERTNDKLTTGEYIFSITEKKTYNIFIRIYYADNTTQDFTIINNHLNTKFTLTKEVVEYRVFVEKIIVGEKYNDTLYLQLEKGNTQTNWEAFTGNQSSPNPDYPQKIKTITESLNVTSCNKNIFDKNKPNILNAYIDGNDGTIGSYNVTSIFVKCKQNTNYAISKIISSRFIVGTTSIKPKNKVICNTFKRNDSATNITISTNSNDKYLIVYVLNSKDELTLNEIFDSLQIEENSTATSFEEYVHSQITANLPEGEFIGKLSDTEKDTLNVKYNEKDGQYHLVLNKMISKVTLDGSEKWSKSGGSTSDILVATMNINNMIDGKAISTHFKYSSQIEINSFSIYNSGKNIRICVDVLKYADINSIKDWLSTHNTEVYYILAVPYEIDLGIVNMPISYNEITNIFTDSDLLPQINVKYYRNFTKTIQNLQINNDTLKNELTSIENRLTALENASATVESEVSE